MTATEIYEVERAFRTFKQEHLEPRPAWSYFSLTVREHLGHLMTLPTIKLHIKGDRVCRPPTLIQHNWIVTYSQKWPG